MFDSGVSKLVIHNLVVTCWNWLHPACAIAASSPIRPSARTMSSWPAPIPGRFDILTSWCPSEMTQVTTQVPTQSTWKLRLIGKCIWHWRDPFILSFEDNGRNTISSHVKQSLIFLFSQKSTRKRVLSVLTWFLFSRSSSKNIIQSKPQSTSSALVSTTFRHLAPTS